MGKDSFTFKRGLAAILLTILIVGPWIGIGILLNKEKSDSLSVDRSTRLTCTDVKYYSCSDDKTCLNAAKEIMDHCPAVDTHNDLPYTFIRYQNGSKVTQAGENYGIDLNQPFNNLYENDILNKENNDSHTTIPLMKAGRLFGQFWSIYSSCSTNFKDAVTWALQQIDITKEFVRKYPEFEFGFDPWAAKRLMNDGTIASMLGLEGGHMIDSKLSVLRQMFELGIRYMTLTHNCNTPWVDNNLADSNSELVRSDGLSEFGEEVIREMNRLGMFVDISHVSTAAMLDVLNITKAPVMFSHSGARAVTDNVRNVPDEVLLKVKDNNGVVCIVFYSAFVSDAYNSSDSTTLPTIADVANHFDHIKQLIGAEHLCFGADYNGVPSVPSGLENVSTYPNLIAELLKRGWTQNEVQGILQENLLRAWAQVYDVSIKLQKEAPLGNGIFMSETDYRDDETSCSILYA